METSSKIAVGIAVVIVLFVFATLMPASVRSLFGLGGKTAEQMAALGELNSETMSNDGTDGLGKQDIIVGTGAEATPGKEVSVHYVGTFLNGEKFDSSLDRGQPFAFMLGSGMVIKGWDQGVAGMKVGGKRKLVIPPELGYGAQQVGPIAPNSTLVFEVELLGVK